MPRVKAKKAAKDYPSIGVKKGEVYYSWKFRYGGKRMSKTPPRPSQLTQSKMSGAYAAVEAVEDALKGDFTQEDIKAALEQAAEDIRGVASEYEESMENMAVQAGSVYEEMEQKVSDLNDWADTLESDASEVEQLSASEHVDEDLEVKGEDAKGNEVLLKGEARGVEEFGDLEPDEQASMREAIREAAEANLSCPF